MFEKKLGFGLMRLPHTDPDNEGTIDYELLKKMVDTFMERGFNYFDTAWMYNRNKSEGAVKEVLTSRYPRESFILTTKLPNYKLKSLEDRDKIFETQLERTGAGYFDYYFLHDINQQSLVNFEKYDCFTWIKELKAQGKVRHIGFSFHESAELLDKVLTEHPEFEVVQLQINYLDWEDAGVQSRACYEVAKKHGKPVFVMEPVKGGSLANVPPKAEELLRGLDPSMSIPSWAIRFAASLDNVALVLSGMSNIEQLLDNTDYMADFKPLTEPEVAVLFEVAKVINDDIAIPCTGCAYCIVDCPMNIPIPKYFTLYNADQHEIKKSWTAQSIYYDSLAEHHGKASACIECGNCEKMCPQRLHIRELLKDVAKQFE
ncbi:MAG: aldo/keto reductase [Firmicutes bacterium]|nr:aldo/keto reductase [Bacillota bacterium]